MESAPSNNDIALEFEAIADLLEVQGANPFRIRAYRQGAEQMRHVDETIAGLVEAGGEDSLKGIPGIGRGLTGLIVEFVQTGKTNLRRDLLASVSPEDVFRQIPGIGEDLARRIVDSLGISSLEDLEEAAYDGRLIRVEGFGERRVELVRSILAGTLSRYAQRRSRQASTGKMINVEEPPVSLLLDIDAEYRAGAETGTLRRIAPRRFNPEGEAWLPVMSRRKDGWNFTVLYSNTARAHELHKVRDWVVIYYEQVDREDQVTVVTEAIGGLGKKRVVKGREAECLRYYYSKEA